MAGLGNVGGMLPGLDAPASRAEEGDIAQRLVCPVSPEEPGPVAVQEDTGEALEVMTADEAVPAEGAIPRAILMDRMGRLEARICTLRRQVTFFGKGERE